MKNSEIRNIVIEREDEILDLIERTVRKALHPEDNKFYTIYFDIDDEEFFVAEEYNLSTYEDYSWAFKLLTIEHRYNENEFDDMEFNTGFTIEDYIYQAIADTDLTNYYYDKLLEDLDIDD